MGIKISSIYIGFHLFQWAAARFALFFSEIQQELRNIQKVRINHSGGVANEKYFIKFGCTFIWRNPSFKSNNVKTNFPFNLLKQSSISGNGYFCFCTRAFNGRKSTHNLMSPFFFFTSTIRAQYGEILRWIIPRASRSSTISRIYLRSWNANFLGA